MMCIEFDITKFTDIGIQQEHLKHRAVQFYNEKYQIYNSIQAESILEIGFNDLFNAITFLNTKFGKKYKGINLGIDKKLKEMKDQKIYEDLKIRYDFDILTNDIEHISTFEELGIYEVYDLIHINSQYLEADLLYYMLELAIRKAKWIIIDKYFVNSQVMISVNYFIGKYRSLIDNCKIITEEVGQFLVKVKRNYVVTNKGYKELETCYDADYYLNDCGGFNMFLTSSGLELDQRLKEILEIVNPQSEDYILDVGCGRGELTYAMYMQGATVLGVDYSQDAINISKTTYTKYINERLQYICTDILYMQEEKKFNKIIMADVYEHIEQGQLNILLNKLKRLLAIGGILIIHTAPNKLFYDINYNRKRELVYNLGGYLPHNPRSLQEDIMHINEQTPATMRDDLGRIFTYYKVWAGGTERAFTNVHDDESNFNSIFAMCSNQDILEKHLLKFKYEKLNTNDLDIRIEILETNKEIKFKDKIQVKIINNTSQILKSSQPYPIYLSYHILGKNKDIIIHDGIRTTIEKPINQLSQHIQNVLINSHGLSEGIYTFRICIMQERFCWFDEINKNCYKDIQIRI